MSTLEIVSPTIVDGIEFYVSADGKQSGVSQAGLARLCGVGTSTINQISTDVQGSGASAKAPVELVKQLSRNTFHLPLTSTKQVKVIDSKAAARIIRYYAFETKRPTKEAKYSLGKFAEIGIDTWIKEVTGFAESNDIAGMFKSISSQLNLMASEITEMKVQLIQTEGYRAARVELGGLREWMETIEAKEFLESSKKIDEAEPVYTLNEWALMAQDGLILSRSNKHSIANMVSSVYKMMALEMPPKKQMLNAKGHKLPPLSKPTQRNILYFSIFATQNWWQNLIRPTKLTLISFLHRASASY